MFWYKNKKNLSNEHPIPFLNQIFKNILYYAILNIPNFGLRNSKFSKEMQPLFG